MLKEPVVLLGIFNLVVYFAVAFIKIVILNHPQDLLWYSNIALGLTAIALLYKNSFLLSVLFCLVIIPEGLWVLSFMENIIYDQNIFIAADYVFKQGYSSIEFLVSMHHLLLIPLVFVGLILLKRVSSYGWLGAALFLLSVSLLSYFVGSKEDNINCVYRLKEGGVCGTLLKPFYSVTNAWPLPAMNVLGSLLVYLPLNFLLVFSAKKVGWKIN